ncbi:MAG: hypothetical protein ABI416_11510 [Ginsengibacter sp.]
MKTIKKNSHLARLVITVAIVMFLISCQKENLKEGNSNEAGTIAADFNKNIFNHFGFSPWHLRSSGEPVSRIIGEMAEPDQFTCYGLVYDNIGGHFTNITITHNGGLTWLAKSIPGFEDNDAIGVAATKSRSVHVLGVNYVKGGGNFFRSNNGGATWNREAANAYASPASFPDVIEFFDPQHGVIFGDPENGYYEIYTTSNGGNSWSRVPSGKIPAPLANEFGVPFHADAYGNTMWMIVSSVDENFNIISSRLLQSDDKGTNWYVRNPLLAFSGYDASIKFRNRSVGLYKNNGILYRTTDGGTTWNVVSYSGNWFSYDLDNIPGLPGWWISTGGGDPGNVLSLYGFGSSISYDDGNHWVTLDTLNHTCIDMTGPFHGYSGGITTNSGNDGVFVYSLLPSRLSSLKEEGNTLTNNAAQLRNLTRSSGNVFIPGDKSKFLRNLKHP